ncbi:MAG: cobyric acid synthase [Candidatus Dormibacteraeota bacterium]|nr:cobyric acid synthase [Candidatus Dormibacteraeota bacterium]
MLQGTSSSVGKSFLCAGLCRLYARRGLRVAPFKSQNMALNAAVTPDGAEIGRAQAVQAEAAGVPAEAAMNPVLLKAEGNRVTQVVVMGRAIGSFGAGEYRELRTSLWPEVRKALADLRRRFDLVVIEGAGSPAEVNLRRGEIVNMRVAAAARAPVLLVGDIDRGGIFASLLGTLDLLTPTERDRVAGLVVNRFRGDPSLFTDGVAFLARRSGRPVLGVVPHLDQVRLPAEDSLELLTVAGGAEGAVLDVAVVALERISNFDELQPLAVEPGVRVRLVRAPGELGHPDLIVLPGSKATASDLERLRSGGLAAAIVAAREHGVPVLGICGGYQMLGRRIDDPLGMEPAGSGEGLGLLPTGVCFDRTKVTVERRARVVGHPGLLARVGGTEVRGYEIRMGRISGEERPALDLGDRLDGCVSEDGWVVGTSVHGLLGNRAFRRAVLEALAERRGVPLPPPGPEPPDPFDTLADALEDSLDIPRLDHIIGLAPP